MDKLGEANSEKGNRESTHSKNFGLITLYHVLMRTGWIFKTETIIMPAFLGLIGGSAWMLGCLPMLNRFGQSVPPLLSSDWLRNRKIKKHGLVACSTIMGCCFLLLSALWFFAGSSRPPWLPIAFLAVYAVFFAATGVNELIGSTLVGKLVEVRRRGRLILVSTTIGALTAVTCAWFLLRRWLDHDSGQFGLIFGTTGILFLVGAFVASRLIEHEDIPTGTKRNGLDLFKMSWATLVKDRNFRLLAVISGLMGMSMTLFPHYQSLARGKLELGLTALLPWLIAQNLGAAFFSWPAGWLGDRFGYRLVLRFLMGMLCLAPIVSIVLAQYPGWGTVGFTFVFALVGLTPVTMKAFNNYTLEVVEPKYHPRYLSTMRLCMAAPAVFTSTLLGAMVGWVGHEVVFGGVVVLVFVGWLLTFRLDEPRHS